MLCIVYPIITAGLLSKAFLSSVAIALVPKEHAAGDHAFHAHGHLHSVRLEVPHQLGHGVVASLLGCYSVMS